MCDLTKNIHFVLHYDANLILGFGDSCCDQQNIFLSASIDTAYNELLGDAFHPLFLTE
jgi:hypothetical protein